MSETTHTRKPRSTWIKTGLAVLLIIAVAGFFIYKQVYANRVYVESSSISAPQIDLSASQPGTLEQIYVQVGDIVNPNTTVARVGNELVNTKVGGIIISTSQKIGTQVNPNEPVVSMIDPGTLRVVGKVDEDKGLKNIQIGDSVTFTVDAFGGKQYSGIIDEISPTSAQSGVVFNISDKRAVQQFNVKARFDTTLYPELKNGMSARMWIFGQ